MAPAPRARAERGASRSAARRAPKRCCTTRTTASTTSSTATITTSSRAASRSPCAICRGAAPAVYHNDHSRPETPRIRTLARGDRPRRARPRRQSAMDRRRDAARLQGRRSRSPRRSIICSPSPPPRAPSTITHFDALYEAYLGDDAVRGFMAAHNPAALAETQAPLCARRSSAACGGRGATACARS